MTIEARTANLAMTLTTCTDEDLIERIATSTIWMSSWHTDEAMGALFWLPIISVSFVVGSRLCFLAARRLSASTIPTTITLTSPSKTGNRRPNTATAASTRRTEKAAKAAIALLKELPTTITPTSPRKMGNRHPNTATAALTGKDAKAAIVLLKEITNRGIIFEVLSFLDVPNLVKSKQLNKLWKTLCIKAIGHKCKSPRPFQSNMELREAVHKYCQNDPVKVEKLACVYGYPIGKWNVAQVRDFLLVFYQKVDFNEDISAWDVSNATTMRWMFQEAKSFNQDISSWNTSNVKSMWRMFTNANLFNQDISSWNTSNVTNMAQMFRRATSFNQDISSWDTGNVEYMKCMFREATAFNKDISGWDTRKVKTMKDMFTGATSFHQDLSSWNLPRYDMDSMPWLDHGRYDEQLMFSGLGTTNPDCHH